MSTNYLDANNVIKKVYDPSTEALRTTAIATFAGDTVEVVISDENDSIRIGDGEGDYLAINDDGSINAVVTGELDVEIDAADGDNIAISNGINTLAVNPDGTITVRITNDDTIFNTYNEVTSVPSGVFTVVGSYTPVNDGILTQVHVNGTNIADYIVWVNGNKVDQWNAYFGGPLNSLFNFGAGLSVTAGQLIEVSVIHNRPDPGDFNSRIQFIDKG